MFTTHKAKLPPDDKTADESTVPDAAAGEAAVKAVTILVQALATAQMYGVAHKVTGQMLEQGFPLLAESLAKIGRLTLTVTGEELLANGALFASHASQTAGLARRIHCLLYTSPSPRD